MAKKKQSFYRLNRILKTLAQYYILIGERSNGKSYAVKEECVKNSYKDKDKKFILLRRWQVDVKGSLTEQYFSDTPVEIITDGEYNCLTVYRGCVYFSKCDDEDKITRGRVAGYVRYLTGEQHYKSGAYKDVMNIIFEEFISNDNYLPNEVNKLMSFVSTVARKESIRVFLIGNSISRVCPYFSEWELIKIPKMVQGQIDVYEHDTGFVDDDTGEKITVRIAVEFCQSSGAISKMFFGASSKMTTTGAWQSDAQPHLEEKLYNYNVIYSLVVQYQSFKFLCQFLKHKKSGAYLWYVQPKSTDIQKGTRIISDRLIEDNKATIGFTPLSTAESELFRYMQNGKIAFSDNLSGSEFKQAYKMLKGVQM